MDDRSTPPDRGRSRIDDARASDVSELMTLLAHRRRRYLLYRLDQQAESTTLEDAAEWIAMHDDEVTADRHLCDVLERVRLDLRHVHVPKLADADAVDVQYDESRGTLRLTDARPPFEALLHESVGYETLEPDCEIPS